MSIQVQIQVCRACLKPADSIKLEDFNSESDVMKNYLQLLAIEPSTALPTTFCDRCVTKIKIAHDFRKQSLASENYLRSFVKKINQDFAKSLPSIITDSDANGTESPNAEVERLLLQEQSCQPSAEPTEEPKSVKTITSTSKANTDEVPPSVPLPLQAKKKDETRTEFVKVESVESAETIKDVYSEELETSSHFYAEEEQLEQEMGDDEENESNMLRDQEIYDIMEIEEPDDPETHHVYLDESGKQILGAAEEDGEFILVNFRESNEDLEESDQYMVEEMFEEDHQKDKKTSRKKPIKRMSREIVEKYAHTTENNQHICIKCQKIFSTRTNLIRHIQSHDGNKPYVCEICNKGFTQSGSLKQHMYIHNGLRPYQCSYCDKGFTQGKTLKFHLRRHTQEKPFVCTECNSAFRQRDGLKRHLKTRHNIDLIHERTNMIDQKYIAFVNVDQSQSDEGHKSVDDTETNK